MKFSAFYSIIVGILMFTQWVFFLVSGQVPELQSEPWRIALHLAAEFITAIGLVASGIGVIRRKSWGRQAVLLFSGMLAYSVIASPGYFAQQGQWALVAMFIALLILLIISIIINFRQEQS